MHAKGRSGLVRLVDGADNLQLFVVSGITSVLVTRAYLALTGYPKIGGHGLHIAHMLWGGLLMVLAQMLVLTYLGRSARTAAAVLGGIGFGLFIDEIGKFVTQPTDYFYRPAAALIYIAFVVLFLVARRFRISRPLTDGERVANAAYAGLRGVTAGLTTAERQSALRLVPEDGDLHVALRRLIEVTPDRDEASPGPLRAAGGRLRRGLNWLLARRWFVALVVGFFLLQAVLALVGLIAVIVLLAGPSTLDDVPELGATIAIAVSSAVAALIAIAGAIRMRRDRRGGYEWLQAAVTFDILITQPFNFTLSQFSALTSLALDLLVYTVVTHQLRRSRSANDS